MKEQFVTYEIASKLKELSFDEQCLYSIEYSEGGRTLKLNPNCKINLTCDIGEITLPLWQQVLDWILNKYGIFINVIPTKDRYFGVEEGALKHKYLIQYNTTIKEELEYTRWSHNDYRYSDTNIAYTSLFEAREAAIIFFLKIQS